MQYCYRAGLLSLVAACCLLLVNSATAADPASAEQGAWGPRNNPSREPTRYQLPTAQRESDRQHAQPLSQDNSFPQQSPVVAATYQQPPQPTPAVPPAVNSDLNRKPLPKFDANGKSTKTSTSGWKSLFSAASGLLLVIAIFVGFAFLTRRAWQPSSGSLPKQVFEVLGRSSYAPRQQVVLMRFGNKVLLVNHELGNVQTLSEIDAEEEVERIVAACEQNSSSSLSANFSNVLSQVIHGNPDRPQGKRSFFSKSHPSPQTRRAV
jgi:flagellar biogenesis protein FliO